MANGCKLIDIDYDIEDIKLNSATLLDKFELMNNRRHIRNTQVESLLAALRAGKHFDTPVVVNRRNSKYRIIDGNHRYEALKMFFNLSTNPEVNVRFAAYSNLTDEQESEIFIKWNKGIKQSVDDLLSLRKNEIPIYKILIKRGFPVSIYRCESGNSVQLSMLIRMLYSTFSSKDVFSGRYPHRNDIVSIASKYTEEEAKQLENFFNVFRNVFGGYRSNRFLRSVFCVPLFNVFIINQWFSEDELAERFSKCINDTTIIQRLTEHSEDAIVAIRDRIIEVSNRGKKQKLQEGVARCAEDENVE